MTHQPIPGPDYSGQNLSGRSYRGQDLRGAMFRNADLRGVDFREANLTGADFSGARMGKTWRWWLWELPTQFVIGIALGTLFAMGLTIFASRIITPFSKFVSAEGLTDTASDYWALLLWIGWQIGFAWAARRGRLDWLVAGFGIIMVLPVPVAGVMARFLIWAGLSEAPYWESPWMTLEASEAMYGSLVVGVALAGSFAGAMVGSGAVAGAGAVAVADMAIPHPEAGVAGAAVAILLSCLASWWLSRQALQNENLELDWLRRWSLRFRSAGSTDFREADLTGSVFSGANLAYVRFASANFNRTHWQNAKNLHLANTYGTVLQAKNVRELLTAGKTQHKNFHGKDLHGLDFSGLNIAQADFTDCNLTGVSFKGADLTAAKLTRTVLLGVDLSNARLTGACIGHWNIDKRTLFDGVDCEYVYLDKECKERHPASEQFHPGEFAKLYQEIAHTVDFLIKNKEQMEALHRAMEKLRASYDDEDIAQVQKVERKGEAYKVSVAVPAEMEEILRKEIRQEFTQQLLETQSQVKLLQKDVEHFQSQRDLLKGQVEDQKRLLDRAFDALNRPINFNPHIEAKTVIDQSRKIENSSISNSAVNFGDHAVVNNSPKIANQLAEIGSLLEQLRGLIGQSNELPEVLKQDALEKVETLQLAAAKPEAEAKTAAVGALEALKTTAKMATGISTVVLALSKLFGF